MAPLYFPFFIWHDSMLKGKLKASFLHDMMRGCCTKGEDEFGEGYLGCMA